MDLLRIFIASHCGQAGGVISDDYRQLSGDSDPIIRLTGTYHNLLRRWAEV